MTIIGKILTVLVLVFSVIFLGFAVAVNRLNKDPVTKKSWYEVAEQRSKEAKNAYADVLTSREELVKVQARLTSALRDLETEKEACGKKFVQQQERALAAEEKLRVAQKNFEDSQVAVAGSLTELENRRKDVFKLTEEMKEKEVQIAELKKEVTRANLAKVESDTNAKRTNDTLESLKREYEQMVRTTEKPAAAPAASPGGIKSIRENVVVKRPREKVSGRILKAADDGKSYEISIGGDDGISVGDTLEIFTTNPPEYKGMMKITDIRPERAVGKLVPPYTRKTINVNDTVSSDILNSGP